VGIKKDDNGSEDKSASYGKLDRTLELREPNPLRPFLTAAKPYVVNQNARTSGSNRAGPCVLPSVPVKAPYGV